METLSSAQRKKLRAMAHHLQPSVFLGKAGVSDSFMSEVEHSLNTHELIKLKFVNFKPERKEIARDIAERSNAHIAGILGNVCIFYRPHPEPEKRKIKGIAC